MTSSISPLQQVSEATASERVLAAIAAREGIDPLDFNHRLYEVIDPDALDTLFQSDGGISQVTFSFLGYEITVRSLESIELEHIDG